jgi:hypothetical protein
MESTTLPSGQPSSQPTSAPSKHVLLTQTDLPKLFLYAGLAGLLTAFVICIMRVFVNHFYLCNYKMYITGTESTIEIIREADIQVRDRDVHQATVVSSLEIKEARDAIRDKNVAATCSTRSVSLLSTDTDSNAVTVIAPFSEATSTGGRNSDGPGRSSFNSNRNSASAQCVSTGFPIPITAATARAMNVMEAVPESLNTGDTLHRRLCTDYWNTPHSFLCCLHSPNTHYVSLFIYSTTYLTSTLPTFRTHSHVRHHSIFFLYCALGRNLMFRNRSTFETQSARRSRLQTEDRIVSFIVNNSICNNSYRNNNSNHGYQNDGYNDNDIESASNSNNNDNNNDYNQNYSHSRNGNMN